MEHREALDSVEDSYHLHAICVHDGDANQGHYFVFIRDHHKQIWRKFNDDLIQEFPQDEVLKMAEGGHS